MPSTGQDRAKKGIRRHTEWFVFFPSKLIALKPWWCLSAQTEHRVLGRAQPERRGCSVLNQHTREPSLPGRSWSLSQPWGQSKSFCHHPEVQNNKPVRKPSKIPPPEARRSYKHVGLTGKEEHQLISFTPEKKSSHSLHLQVPTEIFSNTFYIKRMYWMY